MKSYETGLIPLAFHFLVYKTEVTGTDDIKITPNFKT